MNKKRASEDYGEYGKKRKIGLKIVVISMALLMVLSMFGMYGSVLTQPSAPEPAAQSYVVDSEGNLILD